MKTEFSQALAAAISLPDARANDVMPAAAELDHAISAARKVLLEVRNASTKHRANPSVVIAYFDQLSHGLTRLARPQARPREVFAEGADRVRRSARSIAPQVLNESLAWLSLDAAEGLAERAILDDPELSIASKTWLQRTAKSLAEFARGLSVEAPTTAPTSATMTPTTQEATVKNQVLNPLLDKLQVEATEAGWRTAGSQFVKLMREPLVGLLTRHLSPGDDAFRARVAVFLETELGAAILASVLSAALSALPKTTGEVPARLARELRVRAMSDAGDVLADLLMGPLREVISLYLQDPDALSVTATPAALPEGAARFDRVEVTESERVRSV
ncbi:MAG: hypothetical protein Q8Q09_17750 [Deltaproteobacteria bacterium]|nr:hypothetical protein [Deltaproteobacteria bacterium]